MIVDYRRPLESLIPGTQGRVLAVLAKTDAELTMRSVAELSGVSVGSASNVLNRLVMLGLVERREAGSAALVRLRTDNEAAKLVIALAGLRSHVIDLLRAEAKKLRPAPESLYLFGSFARGEATATSDIDVLAITATDQPSLTESLGHWCEVSSRVAGNPVALITVTKREWSKLLKSGNALWESIARGGILLAGSLPRGAETLD